MARSTNGTVEGRGAAIFAAVALGPHPTYEAAADDKVHVSR